LSFEAQLRHFGLGDAYERNFVAAGAAVREWTFDYVLRNGQPAHLVQTINLADQDTRRVLSAVSYVAYARHDLRAGSFLPQLPISVIAQPPAAGEKEILEETRSILHQEEIPLILRDELPELVQRLQTILGPSHGSLA
jgi:hypothetical protein